MRTLFLSLLCLFGALTVLQAQDPGIAYQAVARDADGDPLADAELNVRVTLHGADETTLWQETHASVLTNQFGNLALTFGAGATTPGFGALSSVDWSAAGLHFEIEVDAGAGYASFGDVDVQAVPIAMYALNGQEEEIAALQSQLDILEGDVGQLTSDLAGAIEDIESGDAFLLGLIQANSGAISILQSDVAQNTADLADLMSVITVGPTGITVEDLTVTGDFDITGVFSAATGVFQYLTSNNAEFEDMIAEAAQFEDLTFVAGRGLGPTSTLDIDGTLNVDGNSTMGGNLSVAGTITSGGAEVATLPYVNAADAALAGDIADEAAARIAADGGLQSQISSNANAISALQTADGVLQGNINALGQDVLDNEQASNEADDALELMIQDNASDIVDLQNADVTLQGNINSLQGASEAADSGLQGQISTNAGNISTNAGNISANAGNISANAGAISANAGNIAANASGVSTNASGIASNAAAISTNAGNIATNASGVAANADAIDDNEFRIAATAADMGFGTSTVGSVDNVPQHPGYAGANYLAAGDNLVEADQALDAALKANADADASSTATLSGNIVDLQNADITLQGNINSLQGASEAADTGLQGQISANATAISTNAGNISANAGNIAANAGAISTNAGNIATNASGVSTNASGISTNVSAIAANAAAIDSLGLASVAADGVLQGNIDAEALARANADNAEALARANADSDLQGQITSNDGEIAGLWSGLASEMAARQFGDASNLNMIGANTANLNTEVSNRIAADGALEAYDAYLLNLIENTANTPLDVANIVEGLDYFNASGNVVSLEAPYNALMAGNFIGTTASFDAVDAQDVDVDDAEIQNLVVESNIYSPNGTIDELNVGDLTVYDSSELQGAVTMGSTLVVTDATTLNSTLNVAGETTLGSNVSVQGNVTVSGNVSAADATAAGHLASFGQLTTAADTLQDNIDAEETRALAAEGLLDARADSLAAAVAGNDTDIQTNASNLAQEILDRVADVNAEETRALAAEGLLDARADSLAAAVAGNDTDIQTNANNISSNDTDIQTNANNLAQEILDRVADVNAEETRALAAEGLLDARADSLAAAVAGNDTDIQTNASNLAQEILDRVADVNAEETRALAAEGLLDARADSLALAVAGNDTDIQTNASNLAQEILDRVADVNAEETRALTAEGLLDARADSLALAVAGNDTDIQTNANNISSNDTDIQTNANNLAQEILDRVADVNAEEARALAAEGLLDARADSLAGAVAGNDGEISTLQTNLAQEISDRIADVNAEELRATTREDSIIDVLYWNLNGTQLTLDAGISSISLATTNITAQNVEAVNTVSGDFGNFGTIDTQEGYVDYLETNEIDNSGQITTSTLWWTNGRAIGSNSVTDLDGSLNVDGASTMAAITADGLFTLDNNADVNGNADISGTLGVTGTSTLGTVNAGAVSVTSFATSDVTLVDNLNADMLDNQEGTYYTDFTNQVVEANEVTDFMVANNLTVNGGDIDNSSIDGSVIGANSAAAGTFTDVSVSTFATSSTALVSNLNADRLDNQEGTYYTDFTNQAVDANEVTDLMVANNLTVDGGDIDNSSIDGSAIGANTPSTGAFTTATANSFTGGTFSGTNVAASGTLGVTGTSTLGTVNAGAVSVTSFATSSTALVSNLNADMLDSQDGTFYTDFTNQVVDANEVTDLMVANNLTVNGGDIDNSSIDGSVIGANSAAAGTFTSVNASSVTATGAVTGSSLTDGTATLTAGSLTGAVNVTASGTITGGTLTDGTASLTGGSLSSAVNIDGSGDLTMGSITNAEFTVDASGNTDIDGTLDVEGTSNMQSTLTVAGNTDLNADLDVSGNTSLNTGGGSGTVFAVYNSEGAAAVTITTNDDAQAQGGSATTLTTPRLIVQEDAVYNGDMSVGGALAVTSNVTSAAAPSSPNHLTNKGYVDGAIAAAITPPQVFDYEATSSTSGGTIYYLEGDLIVYALEESGQENYEITVYGADLDDVTGAELRLRGNTPLNLYSVNQDWTAASNGLSATFNVGYTALSALAGAQTNGSISCSLVITTATASYNSGVTIRFWLDSSNTAPNGSTFSE